MTAQRVLVTAGASGIGREIARAFAGQGAGVFVCDIDAGGLDALAHETAGLKTAVCDVSERQGAERMVASAAASLGGLDVLGNNADNPSTHRATDVLLFMLADPPPLKWSVPRRGSEPEEDRDGGRKA